MKNKTPKLTAPMKRAGIVSIGTQNLNGSFTCEVELTSVVSEKSVNFRKKDKRHTRHLKEEFHLPSCLNPILVYRGNRKTLPVLDGQHRIDMLLDLNATCNKGRFDRIPCDVFFGLRQSEAAKVFHNLTQLQKKMDPWSAFHSAMLAKFRFAVDIWDAFVEYELTTPVDDGVPPSANADLSAIEPFIKEYARHPHGPVAKSVVGEICFLLCAFLEPNGSLQKQAGGSAFIRGLCEFRNRFIGDFGIDSLHNWLKRESADHFSHVANRYAQEAGKRRCTLHYRLAFETSVPASRVRMRRAA